MRLALRGQSGTVIGKDYRGARVLAAYEPVKVLDMGLVAKVDMAELRAPFVAAAIRGGLVALMAIAVSALLFVHATRPLERRIEESEAYNRSIVEAAADAIIATRENCKISSFNPAAQHIFGYSASEANGLDICHLIPEMRGGCSVPVRGRLVRGTRADGTHVPLELSTSNLQTQRGRGQLHIIRDVSERVRLEDELRHSQKMQAIGTLASGIAHDFNNLLMGITGCADMALRHSDPTDPSRIYLDEIKSSAVGGAAITRQLLRFGRRGDGADVVLAVNEVVGASAGILRRTVGANIEIRVSLADEPLHFRAGPGELEQILLNLTVNASHAMPNGGVLTIATDTVKVGDVDMVRLTVTDTGIGMSEETRARIFEPFFTTKAPGEGTGLGLSSAYAVVERRGGRMEVESRLGEGTSFRVLWPRAAAPKTASAPDDKRLLGHETILVVEDESLVRTTINHYLGRHGYHVLLAANADEALDICRGTQSIDLLVTDVGLPGMDGAALADAALAIRPHLPVLFISAYSPEDLVERRAIDASAEHLHKPFTELALATKVRAILDSPTPLAAPPATTDEPAATNPTTVLLVEDHASTRLAVVELLGELNYQVLAAADGSEALELCNQHADEVDIIVADIGLPDMAGEQLVAAARTMVPAVAVLIVSGRTADDPQVRGLLELPHTRFVSKPVDFDDMVATIADLTGNNGAHRRAAGTTA